MAGAVGFSIETPRLLLRELTQGDVDSIFDIFSDSVTMRFYESTRSREQTIHWVHWVRAMYDERGHGMWAAIEKRNGAFVGQVGLVAQSVDGVGETGIGYLLLRAHWGRGFATEAARACRDHGFGALGRERLISLIDPRNEPSRGVAERIGMRRVRSTEMFDKTVDVYAVDRAALAR